MNKNINNKTILRGIRFEHELIKDVDYLRGEESFSAYVKAAVITRIKSAITKPTDPTLHKCHVCGYYWDAVCFQKDKTRANGIASRCKNCESIKRVKWIEKTKTQAK